MELETVDVGAVKEWHAWLLRNHLTKQGVWLVFHRRRSRAPSISYEEALDEALAFGWIDSVIKKIDDENYARKFTPRRPGSVWSKPNMYRIQKLRREGKMTRWGLEVFENRSREISALKRINVAGLVVPRDFESALRGNERDWSNFQRMAPSHRKRYLIWISTAKRLETREKRIAEAVLLVARNVKNLLK